MENPEVSIIMPAYKGVRFIGTALESVLSQTFADWELLCVDDGSKDGSDAVAESFAARDGRIKVIRRENGGTSAARNTALDAARGRYIAFIDEDDVYHPRFIEVLHAAAERHNADVVGADFAAFEEDAKPNLLEPPPEVCWRLHDAKSVKELVSRWYDGAPWEVWRHLYRREVVARTRFPVGVRVEQDLRWHYSIMPRVVRYVRVPWAGYGWRRNSNGGVLNPRAESIVSETGSFAMLAKGLPEQMGLSPEQTIRLRRAIAEWCKPAVVAPIRRGVRFSRSEFSEFKTALRSLASAGVDIRSAIGFRKRVLWSLFVKTGCEAFIRM